MQTAEERIAALGYALPAPLKMPPGITLPFPWVRAVGLAELPFRIPVEIEVEVELSRS